MSLRNPTISATSQFISPFDTLPNVLYTNPTLFETQFSGPFDILPNPSLLDKNPTTSPTVIIPIPIGNKNPTYAADGQFNANFDLPDNQKVINPTFALGTSVQFNNDVPSTIYTNYNTNNPTAYFTGSADATWKQSSGYFKDYTGNILMGSAAIWNPNKSENTNISIASVGAKAAAFSLSSVGGFTGIPYTAQIGQSLTGQFGDDNLSGEFVTLAKNQLKRIPGVLYADFRSRLGLKNEAGNTSQSALSFITSKRLDGTAAAIRKSIRAGIYAGASVSPAGPYSIFNIETLYGWGEHDNPNAIRADFTLRSHITTKWESTPALPTVTNNNISKKANGNFISTRNAQELATPFRGDKISVIDFGKRKLKDAYDWKRTYFKGDSKLGGFIDKLSSVVDLTQDFIKFYFTGPALQNGIEDAEDDIIVFRAVITSFSENFNPGWTDVKMIGRADPNYTYTGYTRDVSIDFDIYATDRDELKPIYRKLNALAGYTTPTYSAQSIAMEAPWMRLTIGDLYVQTPVVMNSLAYTYAMDASWEINIEDDPTMMQVPKKISVSCQFNVISDYLPQKGGRFWTLAKKFDIDGTPAAGDDNWLSDTYGNIDKELLKQQIVAGLGTKITETSLKK